MNHHPLRPSTPVPTPELRAAAKKLIADHPEIPRIVRFFLRNSTGYDEPTDLFESLEGYIWEGDRSSYYDEDNDRFNYPPLYSKAGAIAILDEAIGGADDVD